MSLKPFTIAAIVAAATLGEGVFALPYIIQSSGWVLALAYFIALTAAVSVAHVLYLRTLAAVDEKERLLGLAKRYFGPAGFWIGFLAIVIGLLLGFVAYLLLGMQFLAILVPGISPGIALAVFWLLLACLIWGSEGRIATLEAVGIALISFAILFIFFSGHPGAALASMPLAVPQNFFLPFGAVLFALAGWTSVEPVYELWEYGTPGARATSNRKAFWVLAAGTAFAGLLYWLFALGVISAGGGRVAMDTISGVAGWPAWRKDILALVGILSVAVVSLPIAREIRGALEKDLLWNSVAARCAIIFLPLAAVLAGFNNFLTVVSVAGALFISTQYVLIISVGRRTLALAAREKILLDVLVGLFVCAAVYSIYVFVVR
jgi:amino acid permease